MPSKTNAFFLVALLALVMLTLAPPATAQTKPTITLTGLSFPDTIPPEIGVQQLKFKVRYQMPNQAQPGLGTVASTVVIALTASCSNPEVHLNGPTATTVTIVAGPTQTFDSPEVIYQVSASRKAPGLQLIDCTVTAKANEVNAQAIPASDAVGQKFDVTVGYFPYISAKLAAASLDTGPQKALPFSIEVSNFGNADTTVIFALVGQPPEKWINYQLPPPLPLGSPNSATSATQDTATFTINTPFSNGWNNDEQSFQIQMTPFATVKQDESGTPIQVSVFARSRGIYVPGPEPMLIAFAVVGAALVAKMVRRDE